MPDISALHVVLAAATFLGGGGLGAVVIKWLSRPVDGATVVKLRAEARVMAQETAAAEVGLLREIIAEVRASDQGKDERIARLEQTNEQFKERFEKLEERERHMLTRAAVHEAWDQIAFQALIAMNPDHPPPPPLVLRGELERADDEVGS